MDGFALDNVGTDANNQVLSENRAKAVVDYLVSKGIASDRLIFKGYGESTPVTTNDTDEGRAFNRRVEFNLPYFISKPESRDTSTVFRLIYYLN